MEPSSGGWVWFVRQQIIKGEGPVLFFANKNISSIPCFNVDELKDCQCILAITGKGASSNLPWYNCLPGIEMPCSCQACVGVKAILTYSLFS